MKLIGIDVSRGSITVCPLEKLPCEFKRYKKGIRTIKLSREGLAELLALNADGAILEPTGGHYSKLWAVRLTEAGVSVKWVDHGAVDAYRRANRCPNKSDLHDAVALACYGLEHWKKPSYFIMPNRLALKDYCLQIQHLGRILSALQSRLRQQLSHEWPEVSRTTMSRQEGRNTPLLLRHIAEAKHSARLDRAHADSIGTGLSSFSRALAHQICTTQQHRADIEAQIVSELALSDYEPYTTAMKRLGITAPKTQASLLCAAYPFERFLKDGRVIFEYTNTRNGKRSRRNRSRSSFKLACGLGMVRYQSGDKQGFRPGGSATARQALYLWIKLRIVMNAARAGAVPESEFIRKMQEYYRSVDAPGNLKVQRVARRLVDRLFKELYEEIGDQSQRKP